MHIKWMNDIEELKAIVGSDTVILMQSARLSAIKQPTVRGISCRFGMFQRQTGTRTVR